MAERTCQGCGSELQQGPRERNPRKWCSERCRVAWYYREKPSYRARQAELAARKHRDSYVPVRHKRVCTVCGQNFTSRTTKAKYCSSVCRYRQTYQERRGRKASVEREAYTLREIAERDGWTCGLCGLPVDPVLIYPHQRSSSIDHIHPLARGGSDLRENVQLTHLDCNRKKGDRTVRTDTVMTVIPDTGGRDGWSRPSAKESA